MWEKKEYSTKFLNEMIEMTIENYGEDEHISNIDFIKHEYFDNPSGEPIISLAYDPEHSKLAGQYVVIAQRMFINGKESKVILSLNTLTREAYRGQKIFTNLAENVYQKAIKKGIYFCYGAPNPNSHHGFISKLQFKDIGVMPLYLKIIDAPRLLHERFKGFVKAKQSYKKKKEDLLSKAKNIIAITENNLHLIQDFWGNIQGKYPVMGVRDAQFFEWRYLKMPLREYNIYACVEKHKVQGYLVTRITDVAGMRCGMIVDILFNTGKKDIGNQLIKFSTLMFKCNGVSLMGCLMQKHFEEADCLKKNGFFICPKKLEPQPFPVIFRKFTENSQDKTIEDFKNWFFTMGDYDVI